jgi:hypothetical protein
LKRKIPKVEGQKRAAFKRAGEPLAVSPSDIFAEPQEIQNADIEFEQGEQEIDEPEFEQNEFENNDMQDEMGIIYPGFAGPKKQAYHQFMHLCSNQLFIEHIIVLNI